MQTTPAMQNIEDAVHGAARTLRREAARLGGGHALAKGRACGIQTGRRGEQISDRWRSEETPLARR